ncbi:heme o synthase [Thiohalophilus thiocyanatoxydans]|uniref:Protoheme IX farnesyltransferase n=1 Tax=Thiohalophilus thiocyanatoxydans TaxID=381308 RepID=A0A4R8IUJ2_9GAMM|nr:heme o synthase [Thiohalophilus thiocyanatoxydans]TDY04094.1 protoheme IX farnesyltransferase [Thiohalophilus thiocyanatoxydans]
MGESVKQSEARPAIFRLWCDYYTLCKPKVVALIVFTAVVGMFLSVPGMVPWQPLIFGTLGIGLAAASAAAINQIVDQKIDAQMQRTSKRPLPSGTITNKQALLFSALLGIVSMLILVYLVNPLTAVLTLFSLIGYAFIYTMYLKRATPQNIVIGGAAGAAPPVLGWTAVTGQIHPDSLLLFLIIYTWTPPHFWALAIHKREEYAKVDVPMLPVTHGVQFTRLHVLLYTIIMFGITLLPFATRMSGWLYFIGAIILGGIFLYYAIRMQSGKDPKIAIKTFGYSIVYLMGLFALLLIDHYVPLLLTLRP